MLQYFLYKVSEISPILKMRLINFFISSELTSSHKFHNNLHLFGQVWLINLMAYSFVFFTRSSTYLLVKNSLKMKIWLAFSGTFIFNPICLLNEKSFIVGGSSFQILERGSSTSEPEPGSFGELISSSDIVEGSRLFGGRLCEVPWVPWFLLFSLLEVFV